MRLREKQVIHSGLIPKEERKLPSLNSRFQKLLACYKIRAIIVIWKT